jgi:pimeloyl-ACP methyl ester carboxylesterase
MLEYMRLALKEFKFARDYPSPLPADELKAVTHPIHLVLGDQDLLFPTAGTVAIAQSHFQQLSSTQILPGFGHGIETSQAAITALQKLFAREL